MMESGDFGNLAGQGVAGQEPAQPRQFWESGAIIVIIAFLVLPFLASYALITPLAKTISTGNFTSFENTTLGRDIANATNMLNGSVGSSVPGVPVQISGNVSLPPGLTPFRIEFETVNYSQLTFPISGDQYQAALLSNSVYVVNIDFNGLAPQFQENGSFSCEANGGFYLRSAGRYDWSCNSSSPEGVIYTS
jgi:hypothetical protein